MNEVKDPAYERFLQAQRIKQTADELVGKLNLLFNGARELGLTLEIVQERNGGGNNPNRFNTNHALISVLPVAVRI